MDKNSSLLHFCNRGSIYKVKRLLKSEANVNAKNQNGYTPLMLAAKNGFSTENTTNQNEANTNVSQNQQIINPLTLIRPTGLKVTTGNGYIFLIWDKADDSGRRYTVRELERLQTVPDDYCKSASKAQGYKMLGNGWTVDVVAHIFKSLKTAVFP